MHGPSVFRIFAHVFQSEKTVNMVKKYGKITALHSYYVSNGYPKHILIGLTIKQEGHQWR